MIATPPPQEPQYIYVSAILFSPEEGRALIRLSDSVTNFLRTTTDHQCQLSSIPQTFARDVPDTSRAIALPRWAVRGHCAHPGTQRRAVALSPAPVVFPYRSPKVRSCQPSHLPYNIWRCPKSMVWHCHCSQIQWLEKTRLFGRRFERPSCSFGVLSCLQVAAFLSAAQATARTTARSLAAIPWAFLGWLKDTPRPHILHTFLFAVAPPLPPCYPLYIYIRTIYM